MDDFVYLSAVEGRVVARYGSGTQTQRNTMIAATQGPDGYVQNLREVVRIPRAEWVRYMKEYNRAIGEGSLKLRTLADYQAWIKASEGRQPPAGELAKAAPKRRRGLGS